MRPTASKIGLISRCRYFARPEVPWVDTTSTHAERGTRVHAAIEADLTGEPGITDAEVVPYVASYVAWRDRVADYEMGEHLEGCETAWALDLATGEARALAKGAHREYIGKRPSDVCGTSDQVWRTVAGQVIVVDDVKTGRPENVEPAAVNAQLRTLGLLVARTLGVDSVRVRLVFVSPFAAYADEHTLDALDLDAWEEQLRAWDRETPTSSPQPGAHCKWCPAAAACPAAADAIALVEPAPAGKRMPLVARADQITGPDHARYQYEALRAVKAATDQAWEALRRWIDDHGAVPLDGGRVYGSKPGVMRESVVLDTPAAVEALKSALGESWQAAVDLDTSKTAIKAAAKLEAERRGGKASAIERAALDALRAVGAVRSKMTQPGYEESVPALPAKESAA